MPSKCMRARRPRPGDGRAGWRAEHAATLAQITAKQNAIERYRAAFENGTMDDATAGQRLKTLHDQIAQLTARADELAEAIGNQPAPPPPGVIENLQACLTNAIASGTPAERKAVIEALVAEVRILRTDSSPCSGSPALDRRSPATRTPPPANPRFAQC
jgi:hypothetical protein